MKRFEVYYNDPNVPGPMFMVVLLARDSKQASRKVVKAGYCPKRIVQLRSML